MPDDEGLFCLFCGRTEPEHKAPGPGGPGGRDAFFSGARPDEFADTGRCNAMQRPPQKCTEANYAASGKSRKADSFDRMSDSELSAKLPALVFRPARERARHRFQQGQVPTTRPWVPALLKTTAFGTSSLSSV